MTATHIIIDPNTAGQLWTVQNSPGHLVCGRDTSRYWKDVSILLFSPASHIHTPNKLYTSCIIYIYIMIYNIIIFIILYTSRDT